MRLWESQSGAMDSQRCLMTEAGAIQSRNAAEISDLITGIARALVDSPDNVSVEAVSDSECTILRLQVAQDDVGKIIGKQGRTARSLRTILSAASMKVHHRYSLDIIDNSVAHQ
jgi:predicted RNA-binding protein YlqC (UPF0109 family)